MLHSIRTFAGRALLPLALSMPVLAQDHVPAIFQDLDFEAAKKTAATGGGLVILDAMTSWCGPCKQMDRTTWIDPRLVTWIEGNAVAIQLDMDEHTELKTSLAIRAFPTIILFKDGAEFDRVVGLRTADQMLEWLGAATTGKRAKDTVLERLAELRVSDDAAATWKERAALVSDLMWFEEYDEALTEHLWLWSNQPESAGRRGMSYRWSTQRFSMTELAAKLPAAAEAFRALRDELTAKATASGVDANTLRDWIELNAVIGDSAATVAWAKGAVDSPAGLAQVRALENRLFNMLINAGEWRAAGLALVKPVERTRRGRADLGAYDEGKPTAGGMIPAIPMGGMKPAASLPADAAVADTSGPDATEDAAPPAKDADAAPKSVPMIPMTPRKPKVASVPMIPMTAQTPKKVAIPMIPMGGGKAPAGESVAVTVRRLLTEEFRKDTARRYGALLAADRADEAGAVADVVLDELNDARARGALLGAALRSGTIDVARERHQLWLDELAR